MVSLLLIKAEIAFQIIYKLNMFSVAIGENTAGRRSPVEYV